MEAVVGPDGEAMDLPRRPGVRALAEAAATHRRLRPWVDGSVDPLGALSCACLAVKPPGPGVCRICCGPSEGVCEMCSSCRRVEHGLGRMLEPVTAISLTTKATALYAALKQYKGRANHVSLRQRRRLADLVGSFIERHGACVAPDGYDVTVAVPSLEHGLRPHPLEATLCMAELGGRGLVDALFTGKGKIGRNPPDMGAYVCRRELVDGRRVLLVDDTYTTGAHLHSAAAALAQSGARSVHLLVVGRHQRLEWEPSLSLIRWAARPENLWSRELCVRCRCGLAL